MRETWAWSLGWEDPLEGGMATSTQVFLLGESDGQSSLAGYTLQGCKESDTTEWLSTHTDEKEKPQACKFKELP